MTCIHGLGRSLVDYVIYDIPLYNEIINFDLDHRPLIVTQFVMHRDPIKDKSL